MGIDVKWLISLDHVTYCVNVSTIIRRDYAASGLSIQFSPTSWSVQVPRYFFFMLIFLFWINFLVCMVMSLLDNFSTLKASNCEILKVPSLNSRSVKVINIDNFQNVLVLIGCSYLLSNWLEKEEEEKKTSTNFVKVALPFSIKTTNPDMM